MLVVLITKTYRELNLRLHQTNEAYGTSGQCFAHIVAETARLLKTKSILDYGCGKRTLQAKLGFSIQNYDPALPGLDTKPLSEDIVVCTEVLEHIEPEC